MSKKGLSPEEKAQKLLGWFHETKEFYAIKEVEKAGVKATGIHGMQIKDVLQGLVDEGQVTVEKIGSGNYYWSYPGASATKLQADHEASKALLADAERKLEESKASRATLKAARGGSNEEDEEARQDLLKRYYDKKSQLEQIKEELSQYSSSDPHVHEQKKKDIELMKESALKWTDQISTLIAYARDNFHIEPQQMREQLGLSEGFEDLAF